jgi:hypothetical protein
MGLDTVELIMEVEETFALNISDTEAQKIRTVGDLVRLAQSKADKRPGLACATSRMFYRLRRELQHVFPIPRDRLRPGAKWAALIPASSRRRVWRRLRAAGLELPPLRVSGAVGCLATLFVIGLPVAMAFRF